MSVKVLLCSPNEGIIGGITLWSKNVMGYYNSISDESVDIEVLPYNRSIYVHNKLNIIVRLYKGIVDYLRLIHRTKKRLKEEHFDIVHLCSSALLSVIRDYIVMRMAHKYGAKGVLHFHCGRIPALAESDNWRWKILKRAVKWAGATIVLDNNSYNTLKEYGYKHIYKVPNPLSEEVLTTISELKNSTQRVMRRILFVGYVIPIKGVYELVKACTAIPDVELLIIGRVVQEVKDELFQLVKSEDKSWLKIIGEIPYKDVLRHMLECEIFVLPSYTEGFPNVVVEAMACGCPIIASSVGAVPEILGIDDSEPAGIVIQPRDVDALCQSIRNLLNDDAYKQKLSEYAEKRVLQKFTMPTVWPQLVNVWKNM